MAGSAGIIGGTLYIKVNGTSYNLLGNWKVNPVPFKKTWKPFPSGGGGFILEYTGCSIEGSFADSGTLSVQQLYTLQDVPAQLDLANGKTYMIPAATFTDSPSIDVMEGEIPVKIEGPTMTEQLASS